MPLRRGQLVCLLIGFWTLFGAVCGMQVWLSMAAHGHSLARVVLYQVLVWDLWIPIGLGVARLVRWRPLLPPSLRSVSLHLALACAVAVLHAAWWNALVLLIEPYDAMNPTEFLQPFLKTCFYQLPLELLLYAQAALTTHASDAWKRLREREARAAQLERSLAEARLQALERQIQPHFLFNTLNAISALVRTGQQAEAVGMLAGLSDLMRYALERAGEQRVALDDEAEMLRRYLEIQRLRFPDRLSYAIELDPDVRRAAVPVLLLQPLCENAVRHGVAELVGPGRVSVRAFRHAGALRIEICNSGRLGPRVERGIGLTNTLARLEQLYGREQGFELQENEQGVTARVTIPWSEVA